MMMPSANPWLIYPRPSPRARRRLFCFPYAGGSAALYRDWPEHLPSDVEVCAVQLPGRESRLREHPFDRLAPLVEALATALRADLQKPFAFFGHSMGALVAFELAGYLRRFGRPQPMALFLAGRRAAHLPPDVPAAHDLPEAAFLERLRRLGGTPEALLQNAELMALQLPTLRADFAVCETHTYAPAAPLACPIYAFGGHDDPEARGDAVAAWQRQTTRDFALHLLPGNHFFVNTARREVCRLVGQALSTAPATGLARAA